LQAYVLVFAAEAILFIWSAKLAAGIVGARCPVASGDTRNLPSSNPEPVS
jgi:hypothetical protein